MSTTPISETARSLLQQLAEKTGQATDVVLDRALDVYRRKVFMDEVNAGYAELRADPQAWAGHQAERQQWDSTLMDGLDPREHWTEDGRCVTAEGEPI